MSTPSAGTKIHFAAATAAARKIDVQDKPIQLTKKHKGQVVKLKNGWIIIDRRWKSRIS